MDIKREGVARKKRIKFAIYGLLALGHWAAVGWRVSILEPAAPTRRTRDCLDRFRQTRPHVARSEGPRHAGSRRYCGDSLARGRPGDQGSGEIRREGETGHDSGGTNQSRHGPRRDRSGVAGEAGRGESGRSAGPFAKPDVRPAGLRASAETALEAGLAERDKDEQLFKLQLQTELQRKAHPGQLGTGRQPLSYRDAEAGHHEGIARRPVGSQRSRSTSCGPPGNERSSRWANWWSAPAPMAWCRK